MGRRGEGRGVGWGGEGRGIRWGGAGDGMGRRVGMCDSIVVLCVICFRCLNQTGSLRLKGNVRYIN